MKYYEPGFVELEDTDILKPGDLFVFNLGSTKVQYLIDSSSGFVGKMRRDVALSYPIIRRGVVATTVPLPALAILLEEAQSGVPIKEVWHCQASGCTNRENDCGSPCYWCGNKEK